MERAAIIVGSILLAVVFYAPRVSLVAQSQTEEPLSKIAESLHQEVNEFRRNQGLEPLELDPVLGAQAVEHSEEMARSPDTISHRGFDKRVEEIRRELPVRAAAENIATNTGFRDPAQVAVEGWKNSPAHRKNMMGDYRLTGIGVVRNEDGAYFFTQIFVKP